jgi:hypothetical protein
MSITSSDVTFIVFLVVVIWMALKTGGDPDGGKRSRVPAGY